MVSQPGENGKVKGSDLNAAVYTRGNNGGMFVQAASGEWYELNEDGNFGFTEIQRDEWSVYLKKSSDSMVIQIDIFQKKISTYDLGKGRKLQELYSLSRVYGKAASSNATFQPNENSYDKTKKRCSGANGLTEAEITALLDAQNKIRADVGLPKFEWNCELADYAQEWATRGKFEHRPDDDYGENLYVSSDAGISPVSGVQSWLTEKAFWNNNSGVCQTGKICGHYTQIVWRKTTEVGCGINRNASVEWKVLLVCNYNPAGNVGGKPY